MRERRLSDEAAGALFGVEDASTGVVLPAVFQFGWGLDRNRADARLLEVAALANNLRVYPVEAEDGTPSGTGLGARPGRCTIGGTVYGYAGDARAVTGLDLDGVYYVYAEDDGAGGLAITAVTEATGWPPPGSGGVSTHLKLAEVSRVDGVLSVTADRRADVIFRV